jgi:NADH:ubiquinone oxidoreductase subunit E
MLPIAICVGSSCHLKGSYAIIEAFRKEIAARKLDDQIELKAAFCLGQCGHEGVSIKVGDKLIVGVNPQNFEDIFKNEVLTRL